MPVKDDADRMQLIIGKELKEKIRKRAAKEDLTVSQLVRRALDAYLKK